MLLTDFIS